MTFRNYKISISSRNKFILPDTIPSNLYCTVSAPSALANTPRGLVFTNENGTPLDDHPIFVPLHTFSKQFPGNPPEATEIDWVVWKSLEFAGINSTQVNVRVDFISTSDYKQ